MSIISRDTVVAMHLGQIFLLLRLAAYRFFRRSGAASGPSAIWPDFTCRSGSDKVCFVVKQTVLSLYPNCQMRSEPIILCHLKSEFLLLTNLQYRLRQECYIQLTTTCCYGYRNSLQTPGENLYPTTDPSSFGRMAYRSRRFRSCGYPACWWLLPCWDIWCSTRNF